MLTCSISLGLCTPWASTDFAGKSKKLAFQLNSFRYGCILCVVTFQVVGQTKGISNIAYFVTYLGLQTGLLSLVHFEGYLPVKAKRKEKIKKAAEGGDEELSSRNSIEKKNNRNNELMMPLITDGD